ncbi:hypothetical protein [Pedobacter psychrodurus]|uniref:hypothetical protein n=1 Tax=Pedobacter psychrodurus TaxID=2530456 RepID=UPI002930511E|nr:hypothetical protein [Pedobacter psychrodurus]
MKNNFGLAVTVITPILYLILFTHILIIYNYPFPVIAILLSIPCAIFFALVKFWPDVLHYKNSLLSTMCFYLLPFLFAINYTFDFAKPAVKKYWITNAYKHDFPSSTNEESGGYEYYFYITPANNMNNEDFLLQEKFKSTKLTVTEQVYYRFRKGNYFYIEKHRGLLGIGWTTYR